MIFMGIMWGKVFDVNLINLFVIVLGIKIVKRCLFLSDFVIKEKLFFVGKNNFIFSGWLCLIIKYCVLLFLSRVCDV